MSDEKPGHEDGEAVSGPDAVSDAELTDEQLDREAPGVDDAAELEAAEDEIAAEAEADEDKVVAGRAGGQPGRRRGRITADDDDEDDDAPALTRRAARPAGGPAGQPRQAWSIQTTVRAAEPLAVAVPGPVHWPSWGS